jgi:PAS domain S-box-containing protein
VRAEEALRESEEEYRALVEGLQDIIMRFDRNGRHLFASDSVVGVSGIEAVAFIGKTHRELGFPEPLCLLWEDSIRRVFDSGVPFETEFSFEGPQGEVIFNWRLVPEIHAGGRGRSAISIARDMTAHRKIEQDYQMLFREMLDGFAVHEIIRDAQGRPADYRFLAVNPSFERMTGLRADDIVDKTVLDVVPGIQPYWIETYGRVVLTGEPAHFEHHSEGLGKIFKVTAFRTGPSQFACIFADITDRKRTEEQLRSSLAEKEVLLKEIHHRVKNNLAVIAGILSLQAEVNGDKRTAEILTECRARVKAMAQIHTQLYQSKNFAQIDFGSYLNRLAADIFDNYRADHTDITFRSGNSEIALAIDQAIPLCLILNELITNSLKHAFPNGSKGGIAVDLSRSDGHVILTVSDDGVGFPNDVDFRNTESLGMQLVVMLVEQIDGTIEMSRDKGTEFKIVFRREAA